MSQRRLPADVQTMTSSEWPKQPPHCEVTNVTPPILLGIAIGMATASDSIWHADCCPPDRLLEPCIGAPQAGPHSAEGAAAQQLQDHVLSSAPEFARAAITPTLCMVVDGTLSTIDALDVFAGTGNLAAALTAHGLICHVLDKEIGGPQHDVLTDEGAALLLRMVARVAQKGLVWMPPPARPGF